MENKIEVPSVRRALKILDLFHKSDEIYLSLKEISEGIESNKTTVYRILKTLEDEGWLINDAHTGKYRLGNACLKISGKILETYTSREHIIEEMNSLVQDIDETVFLVVLQDVYAICIEKINSSNSMVYLIKTGQMMPLHAGATGKILLAYQSDEIIDRIVSSSLEKFTDNSITDPEILKRHLKEIKNQGYAYSYAEIDNTGSAIGVPIMNRDGSVTYGLSIMGPTERFYEKGIDSLIQKIKKTAESISGIIADSSDY